MAIQEQIDRINGAVSTQTSLISQIQSALQGKALGGGSGEVTLQDKTVTPSSSTQTITADDGYDGLGIVTVNGDSNLVASNIVSGVSIFGVAGSAITGSSGSSIETVTFSLLDDGPCENLSNDIYYHDQNGQVVCGSWIYIGSYQVMKNSLVVTSCELAGGVTMLDTSGEINLYRVTGDFYTYANA